MSDTQTNAARLLLAELRALGANIDELLAGADDDVAAWLAVVDRWRLSYVEVETTEVYDVPVEHEADLSPAVIKSKAQANLLRRPEQRWLRNRRVDSAIGKL